MPSNAPIVIQDGKANPVSHTFSPVRLEPGIASYANFAGTFQAGRETVTLGLKETAKLRTVKSTMIVPRVVQETVNSVTSSRVADYATVITTYLIPLTWSEADIKDARVLGQDLQGEAPVVASVEKGEFVW